MKLDEVVQVLTSTTSADWHRAEDVFPGQTMSVWTTGEGYLGGIDIHSHHSLATWKEDVSLALAWGLPRIGDEGPWSEEWTPWANFADRVVHAKHLDILWCGVPIMREIGVSVDGGRAILPAPLPLSEDLQAVDSKLMGWEVSAFDHELFRLVDEIFSYGDYDGYFHRAGFRIED